MDNTHIVEPWLVFSIVLGSSNVMSEPICPVAQLGKLQRPFSPIPISGAFENWAMDMWRGTEQ